MGGAGFLRGIPSSSVGRPSRWGLLALSCLMVAGVPAGCEKSPPDSSAASSGALPPAGALELVFTYGSEKEKWVREATDAFNAAGHRTAKGRRIFVRQIPMGSGECIEEI